MKPMHYFFTTGLVLILSMSVFAQSAEEDPFYWEPTDYGYNPYRPAPEYTPVYGYIEYYRQIEWRDKMRPPRFVNEVEENQRHYENMLWKVYTNLERRPYKAKFFYDGVLQYTLLFFWPEGHGLVIKCYYQFTPQYRQNAVFFYNNDKQLIIKELYNYNGELLSISRYDEQGNEEKEIIGNDNVSPYYWWGP